MRIQKVGSFGDSRRPRATWSRVEMGELSAASDKLIDRLRMNAGRSRRWSAAVQRACRSATEVSQANNAVFDPSGRFIAVPDKGSIGCTVFATTPGREIDTEPAQEHEHAGESRQPHMRALLRFLRLSARACAHNRRTENQIQRTSPYE